MFPASSRRSFLSSATAAGALVGLGELGFLNQLAPVSAADAAPDPKVVSLRPEIQPLVQLLEESSRDKVLEAVAAKIKAGTSYRNVLTALTLAGVRNIQPRPSVGFKFHAVLVVNSAHQASLASPDQHRWLPIFWAIDEFKSSQAADVKEGNWTMAPVDEAAVPDAAHARAMFTEALDQWDVEKADAAAAGLARHCSLHEAFEILFRYGCRDFRDIGHKAIYVSNSYRTLATIGWQHAEPVLRSLTYALLAHDGRNPSKSDLPADQPGRRNAELAKQFKPDWNGGKPDDGAVHSLIEVLRSGNEQESCQAAVAALQKGVAVQSIWDALFVTSGEYLMKQPGIVALHAMTSTNALRFAYETAADEQTRRIALLQNVAFLPLFRQAMAGRGKLGDADLVKLEAAPLEAAPSADGSKAVAEIFRDVSGKQMSAAQKMLSYLNSGGDANSLINSARLLIFLKGQNSHDYKFSTAVLEDYFHVSPGWRNRFLASSVFQLRGSGARDNPLVVRTRAALA